MTYSVTEDFVFLIKQLVKVSPLILFSELFLYQTFNLRDAIHLAEAQVPWHLLIFLHVRERQHSAYFSFLILYLYCTKNKRGKIAH